MVIINKPNAKRFRQEKSKKPFVKAVAVVLTLVMLIATVAFAVPAISALICTPFTHQETIYIDLTQFTNWENDGAVIRVYTYYSNSNDNWNVENNKDDSNINTSACYQNAKTVAKVSDHLYSFNIQGDEVGYVKVMRLKSDLSVKWNDTGFMYAKDRSGSQNCIKITNWSSAEWSLYSPGGAGSTGYHEVNANPDATSITNNSNIFPIDATFYDYYTDTEITNGWGNINYVNSHGDWEPYTTLNNKIAAASSGVNYPMYFGNFFAKDDDYAGAGSSNMVNFSNWVNNSARLDGTHKAVVGLTGTELVGGSLMYAGDNGSTSSVKVPFFDKSFLENNNVGSVVNTKFPMRKVTEHGITTYIFDSTGAKDNAWLSADKTTMYYGQGTAKGAKDALYYYSNPQTASGYGFFPLDSNRGADKEALNFGFGMRVDVPFNLGGDEGHYGQIKGTDNNYYDQKFTFTGDDDVWVYIDGKLVLDLGGDHQKAEGTINFAGGRGQGTVSVTHGSNTVNNATRNQSFTINNYDPTVEHTLTMFYVERGMVESNLSFDFNFAPIGNELIVDKTVNTADVNDSTAFKAAVAAADTFSFNQPTANGKQSTKGQISNSTYTLKNAEAISFKDQFEVPTDMTVTESYSGNMTYTTNWKAVDLVLKGKGKTESEYTIASENNNKVANFTYQTKDTSSDFVMTRVQLSYVNTPEVAPVTITKTVTGLQTGETDDTEFGGTVYVDLGSGWKTYNLAYTTSDGTSTALTAAGKLADNGKLKNGRELTFEGIPQGAKVKFVEDNAPAGYSFVSVTGGNSGITVGASGNAIEVTNRALSGGGTIYVNKTLDDLNYTGNQFSFKAERVAKSGYVGGTDVVTATDSEGGAVAFDLSFTQTGSYLYKITETALSNAMTQAGYHASTATFYAKFNVVPGANGLEIDGTPKYYSDEACTTEVNAVFKNTVTPASILIAKEDPAGTAISGTEFAVVKVADDTLPANYAERINALIDADVNLNKGVTQNGTFQIDGQSRTTAAVAFDNLPIYQNGDQVYDMTTGEWQDADNYVSGSATPQVYMVFEYSPSNGYNTNKTVKFVTFPYQNKYDVTFDYTNVAVLMPVSSGSGMSLFLTLGFGILGTGLMMAMAYVLYQKRCRADRSFRHGRK